ncbi:MAG: transporter [Gemmatimonadota bacterium]
MSRARPAARTVWAAAAALVLMPALPAEVHAQWAAGRGKYWAKLSAFHHQTRDQYRSDGVKRAFLNTDAESRSQALFLDALYGVTDRVDVWVQVPYFNLNFDDAADRRHSAGVGDIRVSARYNLFRFRGGSIPISVRGTVKIPVVDFPIDAEVIPVGEGQWDYEAWLEAGWSLWPLPLYSVVWLGYRWRARNEKTTRDPGDERMFLAEVGGAFAGPLGGKVVLDGILGTNGSIQGVRVSGDEREIVYLQPVLTWAATPTTTLEIGMRIPLRGKNFPAGPQYTVGLYFRPAGS